MKRGVVTAPKTWRLEDAVAVYVMWQLCAQGFSPEAAAAFVEANRHLIERGAGWLIIGRTSNWGPTGGGHATGGALLVDRPEDLQKAALHVLQVKADLLILLVFNLTELRNKCELGVQAYLGSLKRRGRRPRGLHEAR